MLSKARQRQGLTLIEILVVVSLLIILILILMRGWRNQINKARDAQRKDHLIRLRTAFEEYYNDHDCYPDPDILDLCQSDQLSPYLDKVPCDPVTKLPYCYIPGEDSSCPQQFRIMAHLQNTSDPDINKIGCYATDPFCGWETYCADPTAFYTGFNYGVATTSITVPIEGLLPPAPSPVASPVPSPVASPVASPSPSPVPSPSVWPPAPGPFACDPDGVCNSYADTSSCGISFADFNICNSYCPVSKPSERCDY